MSRVTASARHSVCRTVAAHAICSQREPSFLLCFSPTPQMGKLHFGVTLGWSVVFSILLWFMLRQLVGLDGSEARNLDLYGCCCVVGYSMLPLVLYNTMAILIPR